MASKPGLCRDLATAHGPEVDCVFGGVLDSVSEKLTVISFGLVLGAETSTGLGAGFILSLSLSISKQANDLASMASSLGWALGAASWISSWSTMASR